MKIENLLFSWEHLSGTRQRGILVGFSPTFEFDNENKKRTDKQTGLAYEVVLPNNGYEKVLVKVANTKPVIKEDELELAETVYCSFTGFKARFYKDFRTGEYKLTASADSIVLLDDEDEDLLS